MVRRTKDLRRQLLPEPNTLDRLWFHKDSHPQHLATHLVFIQQKPSRFRCSLFLQSYLLPIQGHLLDIFNPIKTPTTWKRRIAKALNDKDHQRLLTSQTTQFLLIFQRKERWASWNSLQGCSRYSTHPLWRKPPSKMNSRKCSKNSSGCGT